MSTTADFNRAKREIEGNKAKYQAMLTKSGKPFLLVQEDVPHAVDPVAAPTLAVAVITAKTDLSSVATAILTADGEIINPYPLQF